MSGTIVTTYTYDLADRLITVTRAGLATAYTWNDRGDLLDDGTQEYAWDAAGRLISVSVSGGPEVAYLYDGGNDRVAMVVDGVTTTYVVDPYGLVDYLPQVLVEETYDVATRNFYGLDLLAQAGSMMTTYLSYDALSVRLHLDEDGALTAAYRYGPFGEVMGGLPEGYGFSGERWDGPVGLVYLRARYYAPEVGRFVSRDQWSQPMNRFVYVANNAINMVDPSGYRGRVPWFDWLASQFPSDCPCPVEGDCKIDLSVRANRQKIEANFEEGGGGIPPFDSAWVDRSGEFGPVPPAQRPFPFNLNRYDKYFSGWGDLFNVTLVGQRDSWLYTYILKAIAMRETKMGTQLTLPWKAGLRLNGIMSITPSARGVIRGHGLDMFYFGGLSDDYNLASDPSYCIAAGARYYFQLLEDYDYDAGAAICAYRGCTVYEPNYVQRVVAVMVDHRYLYYLINEETQQRELHWLCVGERCSQENP